MVVRIASIGLGGLAHVLLDVLSEMDDVQIVAGVDVAEAAREEFEVAFGRPAYASHDAMLDAEASDLDAALVLTPHTLHYDAATACLSSGVHVLVEKPMVTDVSHAHDLVERARETGLVLQVGYQRHFHPAFEEIRRVVQSGRIGDLHAVSCHLGQDWIDLQEGTWRCDPELSGGGQLYDTGSHLLDVLLWTTGARAAKVSAHMDFHEPRVDVNSALSLTLEAGSERVLATATISGDGISVSPKEGYFMWGTEGRLSYTEDTLYVTEQSGMRYSASVEEGTDFRTLAREKLRNFVDSVEGRAEPAVPGEYGLAVTVLTEAAYAAAEREATIDVQEFVEEVRGSE